MKIAVAGTGYVGLSIATLLAQHNEVWAVDIIPEKVELINQKKSPIQDDYIEKYLAEKDLNLTATLDAKSAYKDAEFVVIAAPTNYDSKKNFFDTSAVEAVIKLVIEYNPDAIMVIKSTIPVGYTASIREKFHCDNIIFSPEFLRESKALYDNLYPSRIIVGTDVENARLVKAANTFASLLQEGAIKEDIDTREAAITIHDPISDDFDGSADYSVDAGGLPLLKTKDTPCTRSIHFMVVNGKMNCYVDIRSNDIVWGFSAVNVFNFTLMQEYIAAMVGVPVGSYFHKADNLHVYQEFLPLVEQVAKKEIGTFPSGTNFTYTPTYKSLKEFDYLIKQLSSFESMCREGVVSKNELRGALDSMFQDKLFSDWAKVIFRYWTKETVEFKNPLLNELFN